MPTAATSPGIAEPSAAATEAIFDEDDDVLKVAISDPLSLDPMRIQDPGSMLVARQLYEGLTRWDPVEEKVRPAAAESWRVSDGGTTFTFKLRPGMSFHDGSPVTSRSFKFGFERIARKASASDLAYVLQLVEGFTAVNELGSTPHLSGLRTPDPLTFVVRLSEPFYDLPALLTHPSLVPLRAKRVADVESFLRSPVGNGAFALAQPWVPGEPVVLKSFPGFVETPDLEGIVFLPFADAASSWLQFTEGDLDVAEVPPGQTESAEERFGAGGFQPFLAGYYYGFNLDSPTSKDIRLRKAVSRAIDRQTIATKIFKGTLGLPRGIVPRGTPGFIENACYKLCDYSPRAARALVSELPKRARRVTIEFTRGQPHVQVARLIKTNLEAVGLRAKLRAYPFNVYLRRLRDAEHAFYRLGWFAEYPVADAFLEPLFASYSSDNHFGFASEKVDELIRRARATRSAGKRVQLYKQVEKLILARVPIVPIGSFINHWAAKPHVQGVVFDQAGGFDAAQLDVVDE